MNRPRIWRSARLAAAWLLVPVVASAVVAAVPSRVMIVRARESTAGILDTFQSAAQAAGLQCSRPARDGYQGVICGVPDQTVGHIQAYDLTDKKVVVVQAFSKNRYYPRGELDETLATALDSIRNELTASSRAERVDYCLHPDFKSCRLDP